MFFHKAFVMKTKLFIFYTLIIRRFFFFFTHYCCVLYWTINKRRIKIYYTKRVHCARDRCRTIFPRYNSIRMFVQIANVHDNIVREKNSIVFTSHKWLTFLDIPYKLLNFRIRSFIAIHIKRFLTYVNK